MAVIGAPGFVGGAMAAALAEELETGRPVPLS